MSDHILPERSSAWRYSMIECQDCEGLDTYGGEEYAALGRRHADETGHHVVMWAESRIDLNKPDAPTKRGDQP